MNPHPGSEATKTRNTGFSGGTSADLPPRLFSRWLGLLCFDLPVWTTNANHLTAKIGQVGEGFVDAAGQTDEILVCSANHDAEVMGLMLAMEAFEMLAVVCQQKARFLLRMGEDLVIGPSLVGTATFKHGDYIVPETP